MTLNLMLTSRSAVYLSGDFRLTYSNDKGDDDLRVQKLIPVIRSRWSALVSFTGIAKTTAGLDVGDWLSKKLHVVLLKAQFDELPKALLSADNWLSKIKGNRDLAISAVGFEGRRPFEIVVSNFLDIDGKTITPSLKKLKLFQVRPKEPEARAIGDTRNISRDQLVALKKLLVEKKSPRQIREALAKLNALAASARPDSTVSKECVTGHLLPTGAGEIQPHEISDRVKYIPGFVASDFYAMGVRGFVAKTDEHGKALPPHWVGMSLKVTPQGVIHIHALRNVRSAFGEQPPAGAQVFWKIAGQNEPSHYSFTFQTRSKRR